MIRPIRLMLVSSMLLLNAWGSAPAQSDAPPQGDGTEIKLSILSAPVEVVYDKFAIPHIYGKTVEDTYRVIGYIHASNRLLEMEMFRRTAAGTLAEAVGPDAVNDDIMMRKLKIRATSEEAYKSGLLGAEVNHWLECYAEGVNAKLAELGKDHLPPLLKFMGIKVAPWTPTDTISFMKYMGWDQSGTDSDLWMGQMVEALGAETVEELWPIERPYEIPTVPNWPPSGWPAPKKTAINFHQPSEDMIALAKAGDKGFGQANYLEYMRRLAAASLDQTGTAFGSNNWVIGGSKSTTGKPILNNDPHLGFRIPSIWYTAHLVAPGLNVTGVTFPGNPFVILGHNDHIAWGVTNMQADAVDYFIETVNPENPKQYKHKGEWKNFEEREETINIRGAEPRKAVIRSTIHGPVDEVGGKTIALAWTGLKATTDPKSMVGFNFAKGLPDFLDALKYLEVPALNVIYADVEGNIAIAPHGDLPIRARGKGRVPVDGASGEYDWEGMIPFDALPISINPPRGYLASANGRPAPMEYPHYLGWMWDPSYRTRRINDLLAGQEKISFEDMQKFQYDAHDKAAEVFVPVLLKAFADMSKDNSVTRAAIQVLQSWDFNCTPGMSAPTIFAAWFNNYRSAVWEDEWKSRNITQPGGGWGFTGDNKREPEIEVLEYMTRENPDSIWFDDRLTPERERRDDIIRKSFTTAVDALVKMHGTDINGWNWGKFNVLHVGSLVPNPQLERGGMPVPGGIFTLNPGSDGGWVGGGASWRQVIDMNDLGRSVGVYPGGQSEDAKNPHYDDQIPLWAKGEYAPLWFAARAEEMKLEATVEKKLFKP